MRVAVPASVDDRHGCLTLEKAVLLLLELHKVESTVRCLGIEVDDALAIRRASEDWAGVETLDPVYLRVRRMRPSRYAASR